MRMLSYKILSISDILYKLWLGITSIPHGLGGYYMVWVIFIIVSEESLGINFARIDSGFYFCGFCIE